MQHNIFATNMRVDEFGICKRFDGPENKTGSRMSHQFEDVFKATLHSSLDCEITDHSIDDKQVTLNHRLKVVSLYIFNFFCSLIISKL